MAAAIRTTDHAPSARDKHVQLLHFLLPAQDWDICRSAPSAAQRAAIHAVPRPLQDPLDGSEGPLCVLWRA